MKKLFVSVPMKGRTEENIRKSMEQMHKIAEIMFDQKLEIIPTYIEDNPPENNNQAIWCLGESVKKLAEADFFIGIEWCDFYKGCEIERTVANRYEIPSVYVNIYQMMPDAIEVMRAEEEKRWCSPHPL